MRIETKHTQHDSSIKRSQVEAGQVFSLRPSPRSSGEGLLLATFNGDPRLTTLAGPNQCLPSVNLATGGTRWVHGDTAVWLQDAAVVVQVKK